MSTVRLTDADFTYLELDAKHYMDKPISREHVQLLIEEVKDWRVLGATPDAITERIEGLEWDLQMAQDEVESLRDELRVVTGGEY